MKRVRSILIVGGGSSGWMTAAYISRVLHDVEVTLIESPGVPTIGVGEATIPFINDFFAKVGFPDFRSWAPQCDATLKTGIVFENWHAEGDRYWHPFERLAYVDHLHHVGHCWLHEHRRGAKEYASRFSFYDTFFPTTALNARLGKVPVINRVAHHLDAAKFAGFLQKIVASTVRHVKDDVVEVELGADGNIDCVVTASGDRLRADLYIDSTGFRRLLIGKVAPAQPFHSYARSLFCDRALVLRFPYRDEADKEARMRPYVRAAAQSSGWIWTIPLYSRISYGYVFASAFTSEADAEAELRRYCGTDRTADADVLKVRFETGRLDRLWVGNCAAIGLAGGFIEPLESTGLAITQMGIRMLVSMLDARYYDDRMIARYNGHLDKFYTDIMHFIVAHYAFTSREDTAFWRAVKHETRLPPELQARLEVFREHLPTSSTKAIAEVTAFPDISWFSVLLGVNFDFATPSVGAAALQAAQRIRSEMSRVVTEGSRKLPSHFAYLRDNVYRS